MALTELSILPIGTKAPDFELPDPSGALHALSDFDAAPALVVAFICNHCPYVVHIKEGLAAFAREYAAKGLAMVAICANDAERYPADAPDRMAEDAATYRYGFPYLFDETQAVAKSYRAMCTPDIYLFDRDRRLAYRGQFDASRPRNDLPVTGSDLRAAADAVLAGTSYDEEQHPSVGCSIKWKPGNAPDYFG